MTGRDAGRPETTEPADAALRVEVLRGSPSAEELAAVIAVVSEAYETESAAAVAEDDRRPSGWQISARSLREPLRRDVGWGKFGG